MCSSIEVSKADRVARERPKDKDREIAMGTQREREKRAGQQLHIIVIIKFFNYD